MKTKIRSIDKFKLATMRLEEDKDLNNVFRQHKVETRPVIDELIKETQFKTTKYENIRSYFNKCNANKDDFIFSVSKMKDKLVNDQYYIVAYQAIEEPNLIVKSNHELPSDIKAIIDAKNSNSRKKGKKIQQVTLRPYQDQEREVQLKRNDFLLKLNHICYNLISETHKNNKTVTEISTVNNMIAEEKLKQLLKSKHLDILKNKDFDTTSLQNRLFLGLKNSEKRRYKVVADYLHSVLQDESKIEDVKDFLINLHNAYVKPQRNKAMYESKYISNKHERRKKEELMERLTHTNYYYYKTKSNNKTLKYQAIQEILTLEKMDFDDYCEEVINNKYQLETLLDAVAKLRLEPKQVDSLIKTIKAHYQEHVHQETGLDNIEKYLLSETHKYLKGRYRKLKHYNGKEDFTRLSKHIFKKEELYPKIINHIKNQIRTFTFYEGRNRVHFEDENTPYSSDNLTRLNRTETLFKSINNYTILVQLSLVNRMRLIHKDLAQDYIGTNKYKQLEKEKHLTDENLHLWYDLTSIKKDTLYARKYLKEMVSYIRDLRMNVAHYKYDITNLFKVNCESVDLFKNEQVLNTITNFYNLAFLRKLYHNNLNQIDLAPFKAQLLSYYNNSLNSGLTQLPRPHKITQSILSTLDLNLHETHQQALSYLFKIIYYGEFQVYIENKFDQVSKAYRKTAMKDQDLQIYGKTLKEAYEHLQSLISRKEASYKRWTDFIEFAFNEYLKQANIDLNGVKFVTKDTSFEQFIEQFKTLKTSKSILKDEIQDEYKIVFALSKFLRKKDLSEFKHQLEKFNTFEPKSYIENAITLIKILLDVDLLDPLNHVEFNIHDYNPDTLIQIIKRDYTVLKEYDKLDTLKRYQNKMNDFVFEQINQFSNHDLTVDKYNKDGEKQSINIYYQGKEDNEMTVVTHKHLMEAYRVGLLDVISKFLSKEAIKKDYDIFRKEYSDLTLKVSEKEGIGNTFYEYIKKRKKVRKELRKNKSTNIIDPKPEQAVLDSLKQLNRYTFLKTYFEGDIITQCTNIMLEVFSRLAGKYYQLERDYLYTVLALTDKSTNKLLKNISRVHNEKIDKEHLFSYELKEGADGINTQTRSMIHHANFFQPSVINKTVSLLNLVEESYKDFKYNTALRNNHNEIIPYILDRYYLNASFDKRVEGYYDVQIKSLEIKGFKEVLPLKDERYLALIKNFLNFNITQ